MPRLLKIVMLSVLTLIVSQSAIADRYCGKDSQGICNWYGDYDRLDCRETLGDFDKIGGDRVVFFLGKTHALESYYDRGRVEHHYWTVWDRYGQIQIGDRASVKFGTLKGKLSGHRGLFQCRFIQRTLSYF